MNYEILISISLGDNLPLDDEFLSKECNTFAILEAKFNDEVLQSDPIELQSSNPELATELGFRLHKKDFQQFRIERKSIKLQCYVEYSTLPERHFIGYVILHLRDAQEYSNDPKYKWLVLLNPKYKGTSTKRPQLYLAFMVNKLADGDHVDESEDQNHMSESQFSRSLKKEKMLSISNTENCFVSSMDSNDFDTNLKVKFQNKFFYIWDENSCNESDCNQLYLINVQIDNPQNLKNLFGDKLNENSDLNFYFKYTLFGQQIKTSIFRDLFNCQDFRKHKLAFPILTYDRKVLKHYFDSYPTIEIQFCNTSQKLIGFITINLLRLFQKTSLPIDADYMIVPEDESVYVREPFPVVNLCISISKKDYNQSILNKLQFKESAKSEVCFPEVDLSKKQPLMVNHYYIAIDLRTIQLNSPNADNCEILFHPFYLQFSYAFFGVTDQIKTYPAISFIPESPHNAITIPHGFCGFNFATTKEKLHYSFMNMPLIVQLIMQKDDTLLGTAEINLSCLLEKYYETDNSLKDLSDNFINTVVQVHDELNEKICEIQVVMFLQEIQNSDKSNEINVKLKEISNNLSTKEDTGKTTELFKKLNDAIIDNTQDIELWKEEQMKLFKNKLKQKESEFLSTLQNDEISNLNTKMNSLKELENKLKLSLEKLSEREKLLSERECNVDTRQSELDHKVSNLNKEIDDAIHEVRIQYEEKANVHKNKIKLLEQEKYRYQEKVYQFERRLKEKDFKIKELEAKILEFNQNTNRRMQHQAQRATSLTRSTITCPRKIIITRDCQEPSNMTKSLIENKSTNSMTAKPPAPTHTQAKSRIVPPSTNTTSRMSSSLRSPSPILRNDTSLIDKIKKERQELIKKGVSLNDPLIVEIDKRLRNFRLQSSKRI